MTEIAENCIRLQKSFLNFLHSSHALRCVGAIVPFPNDEALMIAGLDAWRYNDSKQKMENSMFQQSSIVLIQQYGDWQWKPR